ncbi:helix-turn-helix domain-containing protein [Pseudonocardia sp. GCM10023141]|uniref:helix-turn-helix domain-containing protein n=1 Tax=Pseudonocardia sp. GCM10023141 TaxID=3252653 RepID=UPI00360B194F
MDEQGGAQMSIDHAPVSGTTFYDVQEVAAMFKMSRMTVYRAIGAGEIRAVRIRGRWLVPARVIEALVEGATGNGSGVTDHKIGGR